MERTVSVFMAKKWILLPVKQVAPPSLHLEVTKYVSTIPNSDYYAVLYFDDCR